MAGREIGWIGTRLDCNPVPFWKKLLACLEFGTVSPAIIVPKMLHLMDSVYGREKSIPQLILAGASVDDIYVIVLFTPFLGMVRGREFNPVTLLHVPISVVSGLVLGLIVMCLSLPITLW